MRDQGNSRILVSMAMIVPASLPTANQLSLFSEDGRSLAVSITPAVPALEISKEDLLLMRTITELYLQILDPSCQISKIDFPVLFVPDIPFRNLHDWLSLHGGHEPVPRLLEKSAPSTLLGKIIRDKAALGHPPVAELKKDWNSPTVK